MLAMTAYPTRHGDCIAPSEESATILNRIYPHAPDSCAGIIRALYWSPECRGRRASDARKWADYYRGPRREAHDA